MEKLISNCIDQGRKVYVFIDGAREPLIEEQRETVISARKYEAKKQIKLFVCSENLGVGNSVPAALDWCFRYEKELIILEDDCFPSKSAFQYFDWGLSQLTNEILVISGLSPESFLSNAKPRHESSLSSYPLIWGWACNRDGWQKLRKTRNEGYSYFRIVKAIVKDPRKVLSVLFFLAAAIRVKKGLLKAWDSEIALEMLCSGYMAVIPNYSVIKNTGNDSAASHQMAMNGQNSQVVVNYSECTPNLKLTNAERIDFNTNKLISRHIYKMKKKHALAPIKALLEKGR